MKHRIRILVVTVLVCLLQTGGAAGQDVLEQQNSPAPDAPIQQDPVVRIIRVKVEQLGADGELSIRGQGIASLTVLPDIYEARGFQPAWTDSQSVEDLLHAVTDIGEDGLNPGDYHLKTLREMLAK